MPTLANPAGTWCNHTLERKRSTLGRSSGEANASPLLPIWPCQGTKRQRCDMAVSRLFRGSPRGGERQAFALLIVLACLREGAFRGVLQKRENPRKTVAIPRKNQYNGSSNQRAPKARFPKRGKERGP